MADPEYDDVVDTFDYRNEKDAILFCIEVSPVTLQKFQSSDGEETCIARISLEATYRMLQQRIISQPNDAVGVLLYGTQETTDSVYDGCHMIMRIGRPHVTEIRKIKNMLEDAEEFERQLKPSHESTSMATVFFCAGQQFMTTTSAYMFRRIFLLTSNDDPNPENADIKRAARTRVRDLLELGIRIEPFFFSTPRHAFDISKYYADIIYTNIFPNASLEEINMIPILTTKSVELYKQIRARQTPQHAIFTVPLELAPNFAISVKAYVLYKRLEIANSKFVYMGGDAPAIARGKRHYREVSEFNDKSAGAKKLSKSAKIEQTQRLTSGSAPGPFIKKSSIKRGYKFGGEILPFSDEELVRIREVEKPVIRILAFRSIDELPMHYNTRSSYFLYPTDEDVVGSVRTFAALHQSLLKKKKYGIAWVVSSVRSPPMLAALVAANEEKEEMDGKFLQKSPSGIYLIRLPYANDIRDPPIESAPKFQMNLLIWHGKLLKNFD
ncbi:SPOC like C-terminal domain-containing protein [Lipomyces japonicus]|uniref:SPOC like C-terminal domain-containing protein n=1 Tax=Lipomyces japonicus TaxID=56871 RepID=UPI0034CDBFC4